MSPAICYESWLYRAAWFCLGLAGALAFLLLRAYVLLPDISLSRVSSPDSGSQWPDSAGAFGSHDWTIFVAEERAVGGERESLEKRFRLAGTFFARADNGDDTRKAILDDLRNGTQQIVTETEAVQGVEVVRILRESITLREGGRDETLRLSFAGVRQAGFGMYGDTNSAGADSGDPVGEGYGVIRPFGGRRVGEGRWVFSRQALVDYYQELRDEPERLLSVFDSLKPVYEAQGKISGYRLEVEGEVKFFAAAGMEDGDVVRRVNAMPMTNRRRAEHFIGEFVRDRANIFVLDVERKGKPLQLTYQLR